ncbi:MAG: hypothetical protein EA341_18890 [Mongoliibacter sp.]|uniref:S8/S53 family peptidase n=1 Tax=Mongoliibacter sp. TaxID=2022438 RepID=UPI0012F156B2|nr:S8/S53 family peptidase [Mongoliibacter sp.]TVP42968.1 MAG: hypothetical protein EA341_18890 [Mongoliibacter sp.]
MKNSIKVSLLYMGALLLCLLTACEPKGGDKTADPLKGLEMAYQKNELVFSYQNEKIAHNLRDSVESYIYSKFPDAVKVVCNDCINLVELYRAENIENYLADILGFFSDGHGEIKTARPINVAGTTGDGSLAVSLNYLFEVDQEAQGAGRNSLDLSNYTDRKKLIIATLDSGLDTDFFPKDYLKKVETLGNCYSENSLGWNFTGSDFNDNFLDETDSKHGTVVNLYMLEELIAAKSAIPEFLPIKVLDKENKGSLFSLLCGLHFAKSQKADLINLSLGFYDNMEYPGFPGEKHPIMGHLTRGFLDGQQMLMVAAAGNVVEGGQERNLEKNWFYPGVLSHMGEKLPSNVITVTTVGNDRQSVSLRQNYSNKYVDAAIQADAEYGFRVPFVNTQNYQNLIAGSSFATAIMTGKIAVRWDDSFRNIDFQRSAKTDWINEILPPEGPVNPDLSRQVNRGISYIRLNNRQ